MTNRTAAVVAALLLAAAAPAPVIAVTPIPSAPVTGAAAAAAIIAVPHAYLANPIDPRNPNCGHLVRPCPENPDAAAAPDSLPDSGVNAPPDIK